MMSKHQPLMPKMTLMSSGIMGMGEVIQKGGGEEEKTLITPGFRTSVG